MLRLIRTPLRSTMGQVPLNGLAMLFFHREIKISPEQVVEEFARCHPRRMLLYVNQLPLKNFLLKTLHNLVD